MKILLLAALAFADVAVEYESSATGYRGMGAYESKGKRSVSGVKAREDANVRFTGAVLGRLGGKKGKDTVTILRVDKDKVWTLDPKKKTYRESPISIPPQAEDEAEDASEPEKDEKPTHRIKSARAEVKKTGESKQLNGFKAAKHAAVLAVEVEELATKKVSEFKMTSDIWTTPWTKELRRAADEESAFQKAYLAKLGVELSPRDKARFGLDTARLLLAAAGPEVEKALSKLTRELGKIDGYAVLTETAWQSPAPPPSAKAKDEDEGSALSDAAGAGSVGGAAMGFLGGMAKKAAKKKAAEATAGKAAFSVRTEIKKVTTGPLPKETFELPEGYKKKD